MVKREINYLRGQIAINTTTLEKLKLGPPCFPEIWLRCSALRIAYQIFKKFDRDFSREDSM